MFVFVFVIVIVMERTSSTAAAVLLFVQSCMDQRTNEYDTVLVYSN